MRITSPVLPSSPDMEEVVFAKNQPEYLKMPAVRVPYSEGSIGVISHYRLTWRERIRVLLHGDLWFQLLTAGSPQPQLPSVYEPFTRKTEVES